VIVLGAVLLAGGLAATPFVSTQWGLLLTLGVLSASGAGAGSFSILIGATAQRLPPSGAVRIRLHQRGRLVRAIRVLAAGAVPHPGQRAGSRPCSRWPRPRLLTIPLAFRCAASRRRNPSRAMADLTLGRQVREALRDRSYLCLHAGFFTCGFHIAFLVTHLPGEVALCGLPAGVSATALGSDRPVQHRRLADRGRARRSATA
jgi:hypothetical protein